MKKPNVRYGKTVQVVDGKAYKWRPRKDGTYVEASICCDCSLVHIIAMKPAKHYMRVYVWREEEKTKEMRAKVKKK